MTTNRLLHLSLELQVEDERAVGWLRDQEGNEWSFSSWLGLLTLIERLRARHARPCAGAEPRKERWSR